MEKEWRVVVPALAASLALEFQQGQIIDDQGLRRLEEELIGNINGLKIEIFATEHPPPHFRANYAGETANFTIKDCAKLNGSLEKWERNIRSWHAEHKNDLITAWNSRRPTDCPVGQYKE